MCRRSGGWSWISSLWSAIKHPVMSYVGSIFIVRVNKCKIYFGHIVSKPCFRNTHCLDHKKFVDWPWAAGRALTGTWGVSAVQSAAPLSRLCIELGGRVGLTCLFNRSDLCVPSGVLQ